MFEVGSCQYVKAVLPEVLQTAIVSDLQLVTYTEKCMAVQCRNTASAPESGMSQIRA
jgi:hypothetical protein